MSDFLVRWVVAKKTKTSRGCRHYHKRHFDNWQEARVYQQDLWNKEIRAEMWEEGHG